MSLPDDDTKLSNPTASGSSAYTETDRAVPYGVEVLALKHRVADLEVHAEAMRRARDAYIVECANLRLEVSRWEQRARDAWRLTESRPDTMCALVPDQSQSSQEEPKATVRHHMGGVPRGAFPDAGGPRPGDGTDLYALLESQTSCIPECDIADNQVTKQSHPMLYTFIDANEPTDPNLNKAPDTVWVHCAGWSQCDLLETTQANIQVRFPDGFVGTIPIGSDKWQANAPSSEGDE